jgi:cobalt-zinc-cadmium efflux system outer membrane protein
MRHLSCLGLVLLLWAGPLMAQEQGLTVAQAVATALENHPSLKAAGFELQAAEAQLRGARALASPEVRVTPEVLGLGSEPVDEVVEVEQPLELNGARRARSRVARGLLSETTAAAELARAELVRRVKQAYWEVALADQLVGLDRGNLEFARTLLEAAHTQYELGNQPQVQALKAEVEVARAQQDLLRSQAAAEQARARLNTLLGREPAAPLTLADTPAPVPGEWALAGLLELGLRQRPDVRQAEAAVATARGEVDVARAARRPDVAVVGRLTPEGVGGVALSLNLAPLDWGGRQAEVRRTQALVAARQQQLENARTEARLEIANALTAVKSAQAQANEYRERVLEQSRKLADLAMLGYREGASALLDVLDAQRTLRAVNAAYYAAVAEQHQSLAELEFALGGALPDATMPAEVN